MVIRRKISFSPSSPCSALPAPDFLRCLGSTLADFLLAPPAGFNPAEFSSATPRGFSRRSHEAGALPPGIFHGAQGNVNFQPEIRHRRAVCFRGVVVRAASQRAGFSAALDWMGETCCRIGSADAPRLRRRPESTILPDWFPRSAQVPGGVFEERASRWIAPEGEGATRRTPPGTGTPPSHKYAGPVRGKNEPRRSLFFLPADMAFPARG
jgi:hypothetical protein